MIGIADLLSALSPGQREAALTLWGLPAQKATEAARILVDHGLLRRRALARGWHLAANRDELERHAVAYEGGPTWELLAETADRGSLDTGLATALGRLAPETLHGLAATSAVRLAE